MWAYLGAMARAVFLHTPKWWATLAATWAGGYGIFAADAKWRAPYNDLAAEVGAPALPDQWSFWWLLVPFFAWVIGSLLHTETIRRLTSPRLTFEAPTVEASKLESEGTVVDRIQLARTVVRNCPVSMEDGRTVKDAYVTVEFYDALTGVVERVVEYARWTENPKPRADEMQLPRFTDPMNFRDLKPNGSVNGIDFAIWGRNYGRLCGFRGRSQQGTWQEQELTLSGNTYRVKLVIKGVGLVVPVSEWFFLRRWDDRSGIAIYLLSDLEWENWVGTG